MTPPSDAHSIVADTLTNAPCPRPVSPGTPADASVRHSIGVDKLPDASESFSIAADALTNARDALVNTPFSHPVAREILAAGSGSSSIAIDTRPDASESLSVAA